MAKEDVIKQQLKVPTQKKYAFQMLVQLYQERLYYFARKMVVTHDDANDVLQDSFLKAWKAIDRYRGDASLYTWLYRIVINESISLIEKRKREVKMFNQESIDYRVAHIKTDPYFNGSEIERKLHEAVLKLPEKQQMVFNMKYFDELKYEQISEILETSVGALKASYFHAKKKVEEEMLRLV
ncbi:sigma-70 family RNA polymerase sigma factor [Halosquirtibacter xylanolyticus]|uniref:RNA polymerase sigma factor n=1 Tax=Halosquirtibacter xylanolyticus TaxID=3374599 RepID=UPI003749429B|nr:sigma-70 family RNA polymerase sigma factor [Prolixibacteraceae bacterium]